MYLSPGGWFKQKVDGLPDPCCIAVDITHRFSNTLPTVFIQCEPRCIYDFRDYLKEHYHLYHTIMTYDQEILQYPNAKPYVYGTSWIPNDYLVDVSKKQPRISNLAGTKCINGAPGHRLRQYIHNSQSFMRSPLPITFYRSSRQLPHIKDYGDNPFLGDSKLDLFEGYQFAIVIENSKQHGYFTEKIMDCLLTKTIPIYWGCPNIDDYFDTTGWLIMPDTDPLSVLKTLHGDYYSQYTETIEANYIKAGQYRDIYVNLERGSKNLENKMKS